MTPSTPLATWRAAYYRWRELFVLRVQRLVLARRRPPPHGTGALRRLLILPSDPWTLVGAKGDEAMMQSVVGQLRQRHPALQVSVMTASAQAEAAAQALGFEALPAWTCGLLQAVARMEQLDPDALVVLGADVLDGYYSPSTAIRLLTLADMAARRGVRVSILGFSFNSAPSRHLRPVFDGLHPGVGVHLRDRTSQERFAAFSRAAHRLVADSAFMLQPDETHPEVQAQRGWVARRRSAGDKVIGFNLHPMLVRHATPQQVQALVDSAVLALQAVSERHAVSWLLLSHDYRGGDGDDVCLQPLHAALSGHLGERLAYPMARMSAQALKALTGLTDGVVTGRMHLAIAALGMGVPVAALTYQDKFQGLFRHFGLPDALLLAPADCMVPTRLQDMIERFLAQLPALAATVVQALPDVQRLSMENLAPILHAPESPTTEPGRHRRQAQSGAYSG